MRVLVAIAGLVIFAGSALAAPAPFGSCENGTVVPLDVQVAACSTLIASGNLSNDDLALAYKRRGRAYLDKGELDRSIADNSKAIELQPDFVEALTNRAYAYNNLRQFRLALADLDRALSLRPNATSYTIRGDVHLAMHDTAGAAQDFTLALRLQPALAAAYLGRAHANAEASDPSTVEIENQLEPPEDLSGPHTVTAGAGAMVALQDLQHVIELEPRNTEAYGYRAILLHHLGKNDLALADYAHVIALDPSDMFAYSNRAVLYIDKRQFAKALADLNHVIATSPYPAAYAIRGTAYARMKKYDRAIRDYSQALAMAPAPTFYLARAAALGAKGRKFLGRARLDVEAAMRAAPNSKQPYLYLGVIDYRMRDYPAALKSFDIAARYEAALDAGRGMIAPDAQYMRGLTLKAMSRVAEGQADIDAARRIYAKIDELIEERGVRRDHSRTPRMASSETAEQAPPMGDPCKQGFSLSYEQRLKACNASVAAASSNTARADALLQRALLYTSGSDWENARSDCAEAIKVDPTRSFAYSGLAEALAGKGDLAGGIEAYGRAIALDPTNANYLARRCWMQARWGHDLDAALEDCEHALQLQPGADYLLGGRGFAHLARKDYAAAVADYDAALRLTPPGVPPDAYSLFGRGLAKLRLGNAAAARADMSAAAVISPAIGAEYATWGFKP